MYMSRNFLCTTKWIYLLQNYFSSYVYLRDIYKTLKGIGQIQFVSELRILTGKKQPKLNSNAFEKDKYEHLDGLDGL